MPFSDFTKHLPKNPLAPQNFQTPKFSVSIKDTQGQDYLLADPKASRALIACMDMEASLGGAASHWGGPAAFAEIMSSLYSLIFHKANKQSKAWFDLFHLINDAGHCENGLYALKANYGLAGLTLEDLKKFRSVGSPLTGHGEVHLFRKGVYLSNGPLGSTLAQAQGLAMADHLLANERLTIVSLSDGACMEGEVKEALAAIPGFANKGQLNPFLLIISDNNTKLSGRIDEESFSLTPTFKSLSSLGWDCRFIPEGNDLKKVFLSLQEALTKTSQNPNQPTCLVIKTCKGFGVKSTMESASGGHGFPLKHPKDLTQFIQEIYGDKQIPSEILNWCEDLNQRGQKKNSDPSLKKVQVGISKALIEQKEKGVPLVSISSDLYGSTGLAPFRKKFPEHSFDVGIAEANMISVATGFSKQGFIPLVDTFAQFAVTKGSLPLIMSALSEAPVIGIFSHGGCQDAADGASHQSLSYFAKTCSLPHTKVYCLSSSEEAYYLLSETISHFYNQRKSGQIPYSYIFFLGRETFPVSFGVNKEDYKLNKAQVLFDNKAAKNPVLIVSCGPLVAEALKASEDLKKQGQGAVVINNPCVSDPDLDTISKWLEICGGRLLTVEDHQIKGGMASLLLLSLKEKNVSISQFKALGVRQAFGRSAYTALDLYKLFGLDQVAIKKAVLEF